MKLYQSLISEIWSDIFQDLLKLLDFKVFLFLFVGHLAELFFFFLLLLFVVDVLLSLQMFGRSAFLDLTIANVAAHFNLSAFLVVFPMLFFDFFFMFHIILLLLLLVLFSVPAVFSLSFSRHLMQYLFMSLNSSGFFVALHLLQ